jgi:Flp pilus assembly protein TadG
MLPLIALLLPMMMIFLGFAVDLAYMQTTRMELQSAADSAARASHAAVANRRRKRRPRFRRADSEPELCGGRRAQPAE